MVTLDHSSSRLPARLFSTLSLLLHLLGPGAGPGEQPQRGEGRLPWTLEEEDAGFPGIAGRAGNPQVRCHSPLWVATFHPYSISLVSPGSWQGWALGNWLPLVCVCEIRLLTETAGVINCLSHLVTVQRQTAAQG